MKKKICNKYISYDIMLIKLRDDACFNNCFKLLNIREKFNIMIVTRTTRKQYST